MIVSSAATEPAQSSGRRDPQCGPLPGPDILRLLHAVFAAQRPTSWGRAAPPPLSWHAFSVYALTPQGSWRYDPHADRIEQLGDSDPRAQLQLDASPVTLVCVADLDPRHLHAEECGVCAGADAGHVIEQVQRYCSSERLASVVHGPATRARLARALGFGPTQRIVLAQSIGQRAPTAPH